MTVGAVLKHDHMTVGELKNKLDAWPDDAVVIIGSGFRVGRSTRRFEVTSTDEDGWCETLGVFSQSEVHAYFNYGGIYFTNEQLEGLNVYNGPESTMTFKRKRAEDTITILRVW